MIKINEYEKPERVDYILEGFPGVGLISTMVASYLIEKLNMKIIGSIESENFPPIVAIHKGVPMHPARIYYDSKTKLVIFFSELAIPTNVIYDLANAIINYSIEKKAKMIISVGGLTGEKETTSIVYSTASNKEILDELKKAGTFPISEGTTTGINGIILAKSVELSLNAASILIPVDPETTNPKNAKIAIETLKKIIPLEVDTTQLEEEAEQLEKETTKALKNTKRKINSYKKVLYEYGGMYV